MCNFICFVKIWICTWYIFHYCFSEWIQVCRSPIVHSTIIHWKQNQIIRCEIRNANTRFSVEKAHICWQVLRTRTYKRLIVLSLLFLFLSVPSVCQMKIKCALLNKKEKTMSKIPFNCRWIDANKRSIHLFFYISLHFSAFEAIGHRW